MNSKCSTNKNVQLLISLLKAHGIKRVITSPGFTHVEFLGSLQNDGWFEMYSCVDERGAAYMACGMAAETQEPVVITCTEATASRNYIPGLTEAYYRKLPVLAITGLHAYNLIGQLEPQVIDRSVSPKDVLVEKVNLPEIRDENDRWESELKINQALLALRRNGGGPVHINLPRSSTTYDFSVEAPVKGRVIRRYSCGDVFPELPKGRIAVLCWSHVRWSQAQVKAIEDFCDRHDAVVMCDHTSGYHGRYRFSPSLIAAQKISSDLFKPDLIINIGELSGDYTVMRRFTSKSDVWRVNPDGEIRDPLKSITKIFAMREEDFFAHYAVGEPVQEHGYFRDCAEMDQTVRASLPELPFSNIYAAAETSCRIPEGSVVHLGMSNTIRAWSFFVFPDSVESFINAGCRGIDGTLSSLIGASIVGRNKLHFGVLGDLSFFYDLNSLGNRDIGNNLRIMVINNNGGSLFKKNTGEERKWFSFQEIDQYIAAGRHFGGRDSEVIRHVAEDLGYEYLRASGKEEFDQLIDIFTSPEERPKPMIFEVRTSDANEAKAFELMGSIVMDPKKRLKQAVKGVIGTNGVNYARRLLGQEKKADFAIGKNDRKE